MDYFVRRAKGSENDAVIVSKDDYQKIPWNRQYLIPVIQTACGPYIRNSITFYTCIKDLRPPNSITSQCVHMRTYTIPKTYLDKLKQDYKNFTLTSFDEWWYGHSSRTIRQNKNDLTHNRYYNFPEFWSGGLTFKNKRSVFTKYFINEHSAGIFNYDEFKDLEKLGGLDLAEKELDKDVLEIKSIVNKIGDCIKKTFFCTMKAIILTKDFTQN